MAPNIRHWVQPRGEGCCLTGWQPRGKQSLKPASIMHLGIWHLRVVLGGFHRVPIFQGCQIYLNLFRYSPCTVFQFFYCLALETSLCFICFLRQDSIMFGKRNPLISTCRGTNAAVIKGSNWKSNMYRWCSHLNRFLTSIFNGFSIATFATFDSQRAPPPHHASSEVYRRDWTLARRAVDWAASHVPHLQLQHHCALAKPSMNARRFHLLERWTSSLLTSLALMISALISVMRGKSMAGTWWVDSQLYSCTLPRSSKLSLI